MVLRTLVLAGLAFLALTSAAAAQSGPDVDQPVVAGDWITACDAARKCGAFSLPEAGPLETPAELLVRITREYQPGAETVLKLELTDDYGPYPDGAAVRVLIDGRAALDGRKVEGGALSLQGADAIALITRMDGGSRLSMEDDEGGLVASVSLAGLRDVLTRMDVKQRRDGTEDGLILRGPAVADWRRVGLFMPMPPIRPGDRNELDRPTTPDPALLDRLRAGVSCPQHVTARLDRTTTLLLITADCHGYGRQGLLALIDEEGEIVPAPFESFQVGGEPHVVTAEPAGEVILSDPYWENTDGVLVVQRKDRAYGDCGDRQEYRWDAVQKRFRLASYASMPVCRGVREFIVTHVADLSLAESPPRLRSFDCGTEITGLDWGVCWDVELRALALQVEAKQWEIGGTLGRRTGDALTADWGMWLDALRRELGHRWLDSVSEDVEAALRWRLEFLSLIAPRTGLEGRWGNHNADVAVHTNGGETVFEVTSPSCEFTLASGQPPMLEGVGDLLRVTVRRSDFERAYPSLEGCFETERPESVVDGLYFPLAADDN